MPTWVQLVYLLCGVCFILALKGLSGPKTARNGNRQIVGLALPPPRLGAHGCQKVRPVRRS